jgi:outer membrane cobalamin receptor
VIQEQQKRKSEGIFLTTADLDEHNVRTLVDVLRREAPEMVGAATSGLPGGANQLTSRTRSARGVAAPVVILDGIQTGDGARLLRDLRPVDVATMEILRGASGGWAYGTGASGGVIRLTTRQGDRGAGLLHPDRCEVPDFEGGTADG